VRDNPKISRESTSAPSLERWHLLNMDAVIACGGLAVTVERPVYRPSTWVSTQLQEFSRGSGCVSMRKDSLSTRLSCGVCKREDVECAVNAIRTLEWMALYIRPLVIYMRSYEEMEECLHKLRMISGAADSKQVW
jgi:hypothetical protein